MSLSKEKYLNIFIFKITVVTQKKSKKGILFIIFYENYEIRQLSSLLLPFNSTVNNQVTIYIDCCVLNSFSHVYLIIVELFYFILDAKYRLTVEKYFTDLKLLQKYFKDKQWFFNHLKLWFTILFLLVNKFWTTRMTTYIKIKHW